MEVVETRFSCHGFHIYIYIYVCVYVLLSVNFLCECRSKKTAGLKLAVQLASLGNLASCLCQFYIYMAGSNVFLVLLGTGGQCNQCMC